MKAFYSFLAVVFLVLFAYAGVQGANLHVLFGIVIPYIAFGIFLLGFVIRVIGWGKSPVPFRIPTTCGQQQSLPWIQQNKIENPSTTLGVIIRMALEVLVFRSLFRNLKADQREGRIAYGSDKWLWAAGLAFHWSFLIILIRHLRFFMHEVPFPLQIAESLDSFLQIGVPLLYTTDIIILAAVSFLFVRRVLLPQVNYISQIADFFPLFLILGIALSGVLMRYFFKVHVEGVKVFTMGLASFSPAIPENVGAIFYIHLFLISVLFAYFPFSKLMHLGGVFLSPTRNLANTNRMVRHVNPWDYPVEVHTYEEYEEEFRTKMKSVGLPVEKED